MLREANLEQRLPGALVISGLVHECECLRVEADRLFVGVDGAGGVAGLQEVGNGPHRVAGPREVASEESVDLLRRVGVELLERFTDDAVQLAAAARYEPGVGDLLDEAVAEAVLRCGAAALLDDEVEALELGERGPKFLCGKDPFEQGGAEGAAHDG